MGSDQSGRRRFAHLAVLAAVVVLLRLAIFDFGEYFRLRAAPNHDLYHGATAFCTSMHSVRLTGDIAWWNPQGDEGGNAQYYNHFFAPLAPTAGHLVFIAWANGIRLLAMTGVAIPEYYQYLAYTLILLPWLTYFFLGYLASLLFHARSVVALTVIVYAFSGIGLWNQAWFYYQEPATLFFLLSTAIALLQRPTTSRALFCLLAIVVQGSAMNYWTLYNSWFVLAALGTYCWFFRRRVVKLGTWLKALVRTRPIGCAAAGMACALTLGVWSVLMAQVMREQHGNYVRHAAKVDQAPYSEAQAYNRIGDFAGHTTGLFTPKVVWPLNAQKGPSNEIHKARYLGAFLLPFLVLACVMTWATRDRWMFTLILVLVAICMGAGWLLKVWSWTPMMNQIQHQFYFYSHHLQLVVVLFACRGLDRILRGVTNSAMLSRLRVVCYAILGVCALSYVLLPLVASQANVSGATLENGLLATSLALLPTVALLQALGSRRRREICALAALVCFLGISDLTRYYWEGCKIDQTFTRRLRLFGRGKYPFSPEVKAALRRPWETPRPGDDPNQVLWANMPVKNHFWPRNWLNPHRYLLGELPPECRPAPLVSFFHDSFAGDHAQRFFRDQEMKPLSWELSSWSYNRVVYDVSPNDRGWVMIRQIHDPNWRIEVNGAPAGAIRANNCCVAIPLSAGAHEVVLDYRPPSRELYWWAGWLLLATAAGFVFAACAAARRARASVCPAVVGGVDVRVLATVSGDRQTIAA